jgi:NTE family protein
MRGPFAAGALSVLSDPATRAKLRLDIRRIVATSSGAISAAYYASAIHDDREARAGARLARMWIEEGSFRTSFAPSLRALAARRGLSSTRRLVGLLRRHIRPTVARRPIELRIVTTNLDGDVTWVSGARATTHEHVFAFDSDDFTTRVRLERVFAVVAASSAFPGVFDPVWMRFGRRLVPFADGGAVNNAAIRYALGGDLDVNRVFVITPTPRVESPVRPLRGFAYVSQLADILINERLARDLAEADHVNEALRELEESLPDPEGRARVLSALGWSRRRVIEVVEIRPDAALEGNAFSAWFSRRLREDYVVAGRRAALRAVDRYGAHVGNGIAA